LCCFRSFYSSAAIPERSPTPLHYPLAAATDACCHPTSKWRSLRWLKTTPQAPLGLLRRALSCLTQSRSPISILQLVVVTLMNTVSCVRTLSIGPRRHGPRLCMLRLCVAKLALRRPCSRERPCPAAASRISDKDESALLATFQGGRAAKERCLPKKRGLHPQPAVLGDVREQQWRTLSVHLRPPGCPNIGL
jgi:hypothetical protein